MDGRGLPRNATQARFNLLSNFLLRSQTKNHEFELEFPRRANGSIPFRLCLHPSPLPAAAASRRRPRPIHTRGAETLCGPARISRARVASSPAARAPVDSCRADRALSGPHTDQTTATSSLSSLLQPLLPAPASPPCSMERSPPVGPSRAPD